LSYRSKVLRGVLVLTSCAFTAAGLVGVTGSPAFAQSAGTSIGNPGLLVTSVTGGLTSTSEDDWWVMYPASTGGTVDFDVTDTTPSSASCTDIVFSIDGTDGTNQRLAGEALGPGSSQGEFVAAPGSDRYYVEVDTYDCSSLSQPVTYSVDVVSGGGGEVPTPTVGSTGAGSSIGNVQAALLGNTVYSGTVVTTSDEYWYQLYKPSGSGTSTVRFEDTTAAGSAPCSDIGLELDSADGTNSVLDSTALGANSAVTYSVSNAGLYYIAIYAYDCNGSDGATYSIEPNPPSQWSAAPTAKVGTTGAGSSIGNVRAALLGDTVYSGTVVTTSDEYWYQLYKPSGTGTATVRFADTTIYGGNADCSDIGLELDGANGTNSILDSTALGEDSAVTYTLSNAGLYYIAIYAYDCNGSDGATYSIEPNPPSQWSAAPTAKVGTTGAGSSIGHVKAPLLGDTVYTGTIATTSDEYWYKLYKPGRGTATVRFADTTIYGGNADCSDIGLELDGANGTNSVLNSTALGEDSAVTYTVSDPGVYYIAIYAYDCNGSDGATYSIEPNPTSGWAGSPAVTSISPVRGPTRGGNTVTIHGTWLAGVSTVRFGTVKGTKIRVLSSSELTVIAPKHAKGTVNVTVTTAVGTSATSVKTRYTFT
jgi:hypothetical protein